ncbi:hypothetical protein H0L70_002779 [Salmonella enterica]|uniref:Uncharacterized protein n=2 Tax=Salmonella enterica I TaxID=59201 RepID=A0A3V3HL36_SALMO|nr:hypothetical protein [Salmonella enterica]EAA7520956.1 hypothetical protein [Salmonella enterica subsp. enterica serovar Montevideo]EAB6111402.1 hypothetical protein [Salmonella enterica subsp. enterica serovar Braenderup]EBA2371800.1 hypothetical protein [Salmonella enterica subsp. enterica serovar Dublin]EBM9947869.1 hypothetical protein [Salmonella enterica subsp. enterica serovar Give]ECF7240085.1 hypothetical protein [Salmonella enterica subsp. enterica]EDQ0485373.1 hypothetical prote
MIHEKNATFEFHSKAGNESEIQTELNDMKAILLAIALKLDEGSRAQLVKELNTVPNASIQEWVKNLSIISGN